MGSGQRLLSASASRKSGLGHWTLAHDPGERSFYQLHYNYRIAVPRARIRNSKFLLFIATFLATVGIPASAHHSFAAVFDADVIVDKRGKVTEVEWMNPHAWIYIDVDEDGETVSWAFELGSPTGLRRRGWTRDTVSVGDEISISGYRARDGSNRGNVKSITLANGQELTGNSSYRQ